MIGQEGGPGASNVAGPSEQYEHVGTLTRRSDGRDFSLGFGCLRIGRQRRADLPIAEKTVSRHHADICYESGRYILYDHSANGTWINDALVAVFQPLRDGDDVKFGRAEFRFTLKEVPKHIAARTEHVVPSRIPRWSTRIIKGGKGKGREFGRGRTRRLLLVLVVVVVVAAAVIYLFFPDLADRVIP